MFNKNIFLYVAIASTIGTATSIFQFNSIDAQSEQTVVGLDTLVITLENGKDCRHTYRSSIQ